MPQWKKEDGGAELDDVCVRILETELAKRDAPVAGGRRAWSGRRSTRTGSRSLGAELMPKVARGERPLLPWAIPSRTAGRTSPGPRRGRCATATNGSSTGRRSSPPAPRTAQYIFLITRTDPTLPKHKGLTMFLVPMDAPGIEIQALPTVGDERTNITYYSDVRISDRYRMGRSTTAGRSCTARWTSSTASATSSASSTTSASASPTCGT